MKKIISFLSIIFAFTLLLTGCVEKTAHIEGSLEDIMSKVYEGIDEDQLPMMLETMELTEENIVSFIGTDDIKWKEAVVSEPGITSIAHSVVLIRMQDDATDQDIKDAISKIKENANPRKWFCVEAENVYVENKGDLVILIMANELADPIKTNFEKLK